VFGISLAKFGDDFRNPVAPANIKYSDSPESHHRETDDVNERAGLFQEHNKKMRIMLSILVAGSRVTGARSPGFPYRRSGPRTSSSR